MKYIPNLFTLCNIVFGSLAIIFILQNGIVIQYNEAGAQFIDIPEKIWLGSLFIALAGLVDFLDGFLARLLKAASPMGKQLDSLSDVVSFGVAPSLIIYQFLRLSVAKEEDGIDSSFLWLLPALFVGAAAAYRLAKFNLDNSQQYSFKGLPTPAAGLLIASFPIIYWNASQGFIVELLLNKWLWYAIIFLLCWLMVSNLPLMALKFKGQTFKNYLPAIILLVVSLLLIILFQWTAVPLIFISYIILSLVFKKQLQ
jgi:CDP-diacylglycerol--serine O-phosphatidyltransferase